MSRQGHLPPRCPFQKKTLTRPIHDTVSPSLHMESYPGHHKSSSQSSILEEQPPWLDDLLSDPEANSNGIFHRRSASDSVTLLDGFLNSLSSANTVNDEENSVANETCNGLESACIYGPNSPRRRSDSIFLENAKVSAFTECVSKNHLQYVDKSLCVAGITHSDLREDASHSVGVPSAETKTAKRHSGQRSRVRKLQYIAELERTVNVLQTLESELSVRLASLLQLRVALSLENSQLKQQVARLKQEKLIMEDEYQSLKKEAERLKTALMNSSNSRVRTYFGSNVTAKTAKSDITWQLDMTKLNLK